MRALSPSERWFWIIDRLSPANCSARIRVHGCVPAGRLESAAAALVAEYPLLRMGISDNAGRDPWFRPLPVPGIPVRRLESRDSEAWEQVLDAEMAEPIDSRNGPARITDIAVGAGTDGEFHDIVLTVSHIIADGRSLIALLRKLIDHAAADTPTPALPRAPVPPADDLIPAGARGLWRWAYTTLADQIAGMLHRPVLLSGVEAPLPVRRTRIVHRVLGREALAHLVADCRTAGVTVHGALAAAVADVVGRARSDGPGAGTRGVVGVGSPVDFRESLTPRPDSEELGVYAPVLAGFVPFGPGVSLWDAARTAKRQLERGVRQRRHLATVAGMRFGTPRALESGRRLAEMVDRRAPWNVSVTNLGRVDLPEIVGEWRLSGLRLAASNSCVSVLTVAVTTAHEEMHLGFCYADPVVTESRVADFADAVLAALRQRPDPSAESGQAGA
ncbi:phthiocerol/phthiodiolone dimycocerosyl transferase family protein [Nocardia tengchongensis]|uniref:phthiocerol/phthiodiolone dimycocerosyl transferase family protein n=1 Tax=Nocardia tengchongensis TaxID=2055889 RepID=UPI00369E2F78